MKIPRRASVIVVLLGLSLLLGLAFPGFIRDNVVTPLALVLWLFWRVLQSVGQAVWWGLLILLALGFILARFLRVTGATPAPRQTEGNSNVTLTRIADWQMSIRLSCPGAGSPDILKHNLGKMLAAMYASRQYEAVHYEIYDALKARRIPLPEHLHAFLFPPEPSGPRRSLRQILQAIRRAPEKWARRWTGRDEAEYYRSLEEVIGYMESSLEASHGDEYAGTRPH